MEHVQEISKPKAKKTPKQRSEEKKAAGIVPITRKYKIMGSRKDFDLLDKMARDVNLVWNYCNTVSRDLLLLNAINNQGSETLQVDLRLKTKKAKKSKKAKKADQNTAKATESSDDQKDQIGYSLEYLKDQQKWIARPSALILPDASIAIDPIKAVEHFFAFRNLKGNSLVVLSEWLKRPKDLQKDTFDQKNKQYYPVIINSAFKGKKGQKMPDFTLSLNYDPKDKRGYEGLETLDLRNGHIGNFNLHSLMAGTNLSPPALSLAAAADQYCIDKMSKFKKIGKGEADPIGLGHRPLNRRDQSSRPWIPAKGQSIKVDLKTQTLVFAKHTFKISGGFSKDPVDGMKPTVAKFIKEGGKWFVSISFNVTGYQQLRKPFERVIRPIGMDLGVKTMAVDNDGDEYGINLGKVRVFKKEMELQDAIEYVQSKLSKHKNRIGLTRPETNKNGKTVMVNVRPHRTEAGNLRFPRKSQKAIMLERIFAKLTATKKRRIEAQHYAAIMRLFKKGNDFIIGDVSAKWIQAVHGKRSAVNSLGLFKTRLAWMCKKYGMEYHVTKEAYSTVTCYKCKAQTGPKGTEGLKDRDWTCDVCGEKHHRDTNAARNILEFYLERLAKESGSAEAS